MPEYTHEPYWPEIKTLAEAGQFKELEDNLIQKAKDPEELIALLRFAVRGLMFREWNHKTLVPLIQLGDLAIEKALAINEIDEANIICFNMSANLANCWNDGFHRTPEHFEKGLNYADRALQYRKQLEKGPIPFAMAYWARGAHLLFLNQLAKAEESFSLSLKSAIEAAKAANQPTTISKNTPFHVLIAAGYRSLAQIAQEKAHGRIMFKEVMTAFEEMKTVSADAKEDAEIGLDQLRFVYSKINKGV